MIAESFERIHRSNLVGMGIVPLEFTEGASAESLGLNGKERYSIDVPDDLTPGMIVDVTVSMTLVRHQLHMQLCYYETLRIGNFKYSAIHQVHQF